MSLHKLSAGDGYTYLTRQVAAADDTNRGYGGLGTYYEQKGESPGVWLGRGLDSLGGSVQEFLVSGVVPEAQVEIKAPKYGSERVIYLPDELTTLLGRDVEAHTFGRAADRWLFQGEPGDPPHQNTVGYWWRKAKTAAGVSGVRLHDLRHFYASGPYRGRLRRRHGATRAGSRVGHNDAADLRPPVANGRGPHPRRRRRSDALRDLVPEFCGPAAGDTLGIATHRHISSTM